jgi:hypothetical protein
MVGQSDPRTYGKLDLYQVPQGTIGPANADAQISGTSAVSQQITLLDKGGSQVLLGETLMVPIANSMVYIRPLYVSPPANPNPTLQDVVAVLGSNVQIASTLSQVMQQLTNVALPTSNGVSGTGTVPATVANLLNQAQADYQAAQTALTAGDLATYQQDIKDMQSAIASAQAVLPAASSTPTTTTTTTTPKKKTGKSSARSSSSTTSTTTTSTTPTSTSPRAGATTTAPTSASAAGLVSGAGR